MILIPARIRLLPTPTLATSLVFLLVLGAGLGFAVWALVFRPLRTAPPLARVVASLGLLLYFQEITRIRFPTAGASTVRRFPVLPDDPIRLLGTAVSANRLLLAGLVIGTTVALSAVFRRTRFGTAVRAVATSEPGAVLSGISPARTAAPVWMLASILAGFAVVLIEPIAGLDPTTTPLLIVPALAAALVGGLASFGATTAAGLGIGMLQSLLLGYAVQPSTTWIPDWIPTTGVQQAVPVLIILLVLVGRGDPLPRRGAVAEGRLPASPEPRHLLVWTVLLSGSTVIVLFTSGPRIRQAVIVSLIAALLSLSIVVITGFVGQISLAQFALAGVAGFSAIGLAEHGWPFPLVVVAGVAVATLLGVLTGLPASRVRGMSLAVATLAAAVAVEALVLGSSAVSGGPGGRTPPRPSILGLDLGVSARGADNFRPVFGLVALIALVVAANLVANLRRNVTGLRWLAVRSDERAAAAAGIDVRRVKLGAFALSSAIAGLAGVLMAFSTTVLSTSSFLVIGTLVAVALTYLAGIGSITGAIVAGLLTRSGLFTALTGGDGGGTGRYTFLVSGIALIVVAIAAPDGLTGLLRRGVLRRIRHRTGAAPPSPEEAVP